MEEKAYRSLNQSALKQITKALEDDPSIDLEPVVNLLHSTYAKYRQAVPERVARQQEIHVSSLVVSRVFSGKMVWESGVRAVIQISRDVAVKVTRSLDHDEHDVMRYLEERIPAIPAPRALGLVTVGATAFMFMTLIPGTTLEARWPSLSPEAKRKIRWVLDATLLALRRVELPPGEPFGTPVGRHLCKDARNDIRVSSSPIYSEAAFNDYLMHRSSPRVATSYKSWLRSMLREDHRILFTHGDFHPRNVMITDGDDPELTGIIDWEMSGFYPEHWEYLKAMNTRSVTDTDDWWDYLPPCILGYDQEVVLDRYIEASRVY
ncbi:hypothetical protein TRAPUB_9288 [Trametes pubescens]|uniref:Aminoglycoside phosphotransferase domain-containing protein n=1 Tax=Trametes pubescens TaxID=154538 RepID=A0A1M2W2T9_TRAPU|nr:hypothetical protein TRAPUB_9288 [Trametes pubescens]